MFTKATTVALLMLIVLFSYGQVNNDIGTLHFEVRNIKGNLIPSKLVFLTFDGSQPDLQVSSDLELASRKNVIYTKTGKGSIVVPTGQYVIWAGHGTEFNSWTDTLSIVSGNNYLKAKLERVINTSGYINADMHLHTFTYSRHGDANVDERLISCLSEGLEWIVATDHNHVVDYSGNMKKLKIRGDMATVVGNEVSTPIGHFNVYPINPKSKKTPHDENNASALFNSIRKVSPEAIIQVNHPRWPGGDYFSYKNLDIFTASTESEEWSWDFDIYELLNENRSLGWKEESGNPFSVKRDWFNMLDDGRKITVVGNSDSHTVIDAIAGIPRNYIASSTDIPSEINEKEIVENLKNGHVTISSGIYLSVETNNGKIPGDVDVPKNGHVQLSINVQAPRWVDCDYVQVIVNGYEFHRWETRTNDVVRLSETLNIPINQDSWIVVIAEGDEPMDPLVADYNGAIRPLAISNPVWVDFNSDGKLQSHNAYVFEKIEKNVGNADQFLQLIKENPPYMMPALRYIYQNHPDYEVEAIKSIYDGGNTEIKRFCLHILGKTNHPDALKLLDALSKVRNEENPLLRIWIENARLAQGSDKLKSELKFFKITDTDLNWMEERLRFMSAGENSQNYKLSLNGKKDDQNIVVEDPFIVTEDYFLMNSGRKITLTQELFSKEDIELPFFIYTNNSVTVYANDKEVVSRKFDANKLFMSVVRVPLKRGKNSLSYVIDKEPLGAGITILPIDKHNILDPTLAEKKVYRHSGYNFKYTSSENPEPRYKGNESSFTDGWLGSLHYNDGFWTGYKKNELEFTFEFPINSNVHSIEVRTLHDPDSWIFSPKEVVFMKSSNGTDFTQFEVNKIDGKLSDEVKIISSKTTFSDETKYLRVKIKSIGTIPSGHPGKGQDAWIFMDEIIFK